MATIAFSQPEYSISEGGGSVSTGSVCLSLVSISLAEGVSAIDGVTVAIAIIDVRGNDTVLEEFNSTISLESSALGQQIFCARPSFPDDNILQGNVQFFAFASVVVLGRDSVTFVPERDQAIITVTDDDSMYSRQLDVCVIVLLQSFLNSSSTAYYSQKILQFGHLHILTQIQYYGGPIL
jgi:hypothetical protein